ncbi:polysaccharide export outer membrane protein [Duganella sp. CF517]|uniref:polysaccharide export protein EpsE n=1 Tax=Duganella sp. CF517 TaxID=1881038 RepID=UPI0008AD80B0|nr:polysaccharide export protein EpsE [Duganella sp. CF517]SEN48413.1 polysaccharide export outer membrane protein [Duganella sp. CF517]
MKRLVFWMMASLLALTLGTAGAAELLLGPGDVVKVSVYNNPDLTTETRVSASGFITFPLVGQVAVAGLPTAAAEKKLAQLLVSGGFVKNPQVNMIVTVLQSQQVSVLGQVGRPGRYPLDGSRSVLDVLALAGGVGAEGGDTVTVLRTRNGTTTKDVIDVAELVRTSNMKADLDLSGNDVVYVERAPRFYIYGEVQRPGMFRIERSMTVLQALAAGGGLTPRGTERGLRIKRRDAEGKLQILEAKYDDLVQNDDVLYVRESLF